MRSRLDAFIQANGGSVAGPVLTGTAFDALVCRVVNGVILPWQRRALWNRYEAEHPPDVVAWIRDAMRAEERPTR